MQTKEMFYISHHNSYPPIEIRNEQIQVVKLRSKIELEHSDESNCKQILLNVSFLSEDDRQG